MNELLLNSFEVGMLVITASNNIKDITQERLYIIEKISSSFIYLTNDLGQSTKYRNHLFIEADLYYTTCLWLTLIKLFDIAPKYL